MNKELKRLNFNDLLQLDSSIELETYDVETCRRIGGHPIKGYCVRCEGKGCNTCPGDPTFILKNISHGASAEDVLRATGQDKIDLSDWHTEPVLFLMEGPSKDYDIYKKVFFNGHEKWPTQTWYWVHNEKQFYSFPDQFVGGTYDQLFNSIVFTFKLRNAYLTNLVKCGLNNSTNTQYKPLDDYSSECRKTCYESFLQKEIAILEPKVIFCFGSRVKNFLWDQYANRQFPWKVLTLPHPASGRRGFRGDFFRHLYYSTILEGLYEAHIIPTLEEVERKYGEFLKKSKRNNEAR